MATSEMGAVRGVKPLPVFSQQKRTGEQFLQKSLSRIGFDRLCCGCHGLRTRALQDGTAFHDAVPGGRFSGAGFGWGRIVRLTAQCMPLHHAASEGTVGHESTRSKTI